jgi:biotin-[acetyl-CoA-carboxylase] ligase BirA-like protein
MIVLTDQPDAASPLVAPAPARGDWRPAPQLDAATSALWSVLGHGAPAWVLDAPAENQARTFWSRLLVVAHATASQYDLLRGELADVVHRAGPVACLALEGRNFHGQRGRPWMAAPGNLHLSVAIPVRLPVATYAASLSMLPAVTVVEAVRAATGGAVRPGIKWVNDIVVPAGKLAGVLTATQVLGGDIDLVVIGIGINVAAAPRVEPTPFVPAVACVSRCEGGERVTLPAVLWAVLDALAARLSVLDREGPSRTWHDYARSSIVTGQRVRVWDERLPEGADPRTWPAPLAAGRVAAIGPDLALTFDGRAERIDRGRLAFEDVCRTFGL